MSNMELTFSLGGLIANDDKLDVAKARGQSIMVAQISPLTLWVNMNGDVFVPHTNEKMEQQFRIAGHSGAAGHLSTKQLTVL